MTPEQIAKLRQRLDDSHAPNCDCEWHQILDALAVTEQQVAKLRAELKYINDITACVVIDQSAADALRELIQRNTELMRESSDLFLRAAKAEFARDVAREETTRLREALNFYADEDNWCEADYDSYTFRYISQEQPWATAVAALHINHTEATQ